MKLGIISDCVHYKKPDGSVGTENHILLRQLQALCRYFEDTLICCPFAPYDPTKDISIYSAAPVQFVPLPVAGGNTLTAKLELFSTIPSWLRAFKKINATSDIVYQRFPNNLNIPGFIYFWLKGKKVFGTYTGTWNNYFSEPFTYKFQRQLLTNFFRGPVWVYSNNTNSKRILPGFSPSYTQAEWDEETGQVATRIDSLQKKDLQNFRLITVGSLTQNKNQIGIVKACSILKKQGFQFELTIVGDGPMREELIRTIEENNLQTQIKLVGTKNFEELRALYRSHDVIVQAPFSEGFGKVPIEGFFHGVIPVISNTSMAKYITGNEERGFLFDASNAESLVQTLYRLQAKKHVLPEMIEKGRLFAQSHTLEAWAQSYYKTVTDYFE
jgi:glycosyltransferase involved in cell wall biosynthesis